MKATLFISLLAASSLVRAQSPDSVTAKPSTALQEVTVSASAARLRESVRSVQMGKTDLPVALLLKAPAIAGEQDVIKALQLTPGVKRGTEGGIGMYVRGGGNDENLILLDGAPVYNAGHLLGFFSVFNGASLKSADLYKSAFPAQYGGRLSSVLDVKTKDGSMQAYSGTASIGLISSSFSVGGPVIKDKVSVALSGRRTYIDKIFTFIPYHFYDGNGKITWAVNARNRISFSGYKGDDVLSSVGGGGDSATSFSSGMRLGNTTAVLRWTSRSSKDRWSGDLSLVHTRFRYAVNGSAGTNALTVSSSIKDFGVRGELGWSGLTHHRLRAGFSVMQHQFNPNIVHSDGTALEQFPDRQGQTLHNTETAISLHDEVTVSPSLLLSAGLRVSADFTGSKIYAHPEPRLAARFLLDNRNSIKASYARMVQYMHLVSSSSIALPTDLWYPVTPSIAPGSSDQVSIGYYHAFTDAGISFSGEVYHKWLHNLIEYREGALLVLNDDYEKELVRGGGRNYGLELFASKTSGRFTGWVGYTLSRALRTFDSLNNGRQYAARYDRTHDFSFVGMYDLSRRWAISGTVVYATGTPFTGQTGQYIVPRPDYTGFETLPAYTDRNALRMSAAFRIDLDVAYKFSIGQRLKCEAHVSMYNALNRTQPGRIERTWNAEAGTWMYQQKGLFGNITTVAMNFSL